MKPHRNTGLWLGAVLVALAMTIFKYQVTWSILEAPLYGLLSAAVFFICYNLFCQEGQLRWLARCIAVIFGVPASIILLFPGWINDDIAMDDKVWESRKVSLLELESVIERDSQFESLEYDYKSAKGFMVTLQGSVDNKKTLQVFREKLQSKFGGHPPFSLKWDVTISTENKIIHGWDGELFPDEEELFE